jgi:cell division protein FtsQ
MKIKTIFATVGAMIAVALLLVATIWASHVPDDMVCQEMRIVIGDSATHQFVGVDELQRTLKRNGISPVGMKMKDVSCQAIEEILLEHSMLRTAECYKLSSGEIRVDVTQRVPILYVSTAEGSYFVDMDRKVMPVRSSIQVEVPILRGEITSQSATEEYYDFVQWLTHNRYWKGRITTIYARSPRYIVLSQREVEGSIILGELDGYDRKMARLRKLYVDGFEEIGYKSYKEYDLRFDGQVIGRK